MNAIILISVVMGSCCVLYYAQSTFSLASVGQTLDKK